MDRFPYGRNSGKASSVKTLKKYATRRRKVFLEFHAISLVNGLKYWLIRESKNISAGDVMEFYQYMMSHSILDLLDIENTEKK